MGLGDADAHARAAGDGPAIAGPADDGIDGPVQAGAQQDSGVPGVQLADGLRAAVPGGMMAGREIGAGVKLGRRQNAAVRSGMAVISAPRQIQGSPAGRRAPGKRSIGPVRAAGVQMPSGAGQPPGDHGHVGKDG